MKDYNVPPNFEQNVFLNFDVPAPGSEASSTAKLNVTTHRSNLCMTTEFIPRDGASKPWLKVGKKVQARAPALLA